MNIKLNREKVIKECQWAYDKITENGPITMTSRQFFRDVIRLLRNEDSARPLKSEHVPFVDQYFCRICNCYLEKEYLFCPKCGKRVNWDA